MPSNEHINCPSAAVEPTERTDRHITVIETELLTQKECARVRRTSVRTLDRERAQGRGCPYVQLGSRIFYRRRDVEKYIEAHVRGGEFPALGAASGSLPRRRGRQRNLPANEVRA
jgi:hypothetical protein